MVLAESVSEWSHSPWLLSLTLCLCSEEPEICVSCQESHPQRYVEASRMSPVGRQLCRWILGGVDGWGVTLSWNALGHISLSMQSVGCLTLLNPALSPSSLTTVSPCLHFFFLYTHIIPQSYSLCIVPCESYIKECPQPTSCLSSASKRAHVRLRHTGKQSSIAGGWTYFITSL